MAVSVVTRSSPSHRWAELEANKSTILSMCEQFAQWTLPYLFPPNNINVGEVMSVDKDSIGARGTNHLANKIINTLFPAKSLFFRLVIDQEMRDLIETSVAATAGQSDDSLRAAVETAVQAAEKELIKAEKRAEEHLNMIKYRPQATNAVKLLIVTGNAMVYHPETSRSLYRKGYERPVQVYNLRNYHVVRDVDGEMVEFMTRETKAFETFHPEVQEALKNNAAFKAAHRGTGPTSIKEYKKGADVTIYTRGVLEDDGKYHIEQWADDVDLDRDRIYTRDKLRWIPLTWNLLQGEDYGRGLVADYAGAFHAINALSISLLNIAAIMGDVKILVDPQSQIDIDEIQNSQSGSYHYGKPEEVGIGQLQYLGNNAQFLQAMIERYEKQISAAFLLATAMQRNAERVTTEEIRRDMDELETSNAGVYSRLAADWQYPTALLALDDTDFVSVGDGIEPRVITGMDSLSRAGEAYNMRLFLTDVAMLNGVPEDVRMSIKKGPFMKQIGSYHQVPYESWVMTPEEEQAAQEAQMQQQAQLQQQQQDGQMKVEAAKVAAQEEG